MTLSKEDYRHAFHWEASVLWARGLPPPTADEIADAMTEAVERLQSDDPYYMGKRKAALTPGHTKQYRQDGSLDCWADTLSVQWCETHGSVDVDGYCEAFHADASSGGWSRDRFDDVIAERFGQCHVVSRLLIAAALTPGDTKAIRPVSGEPGSVVHVLLADTPPGATCRFWLGEGPCPKCGLPALTPGDTDE